MCSKFCLKVKFSNSRIAVKVFFIITLQIILEQKILLMSAIRRIISYRVSLQRLRRRKIIIANCLEAPSVIKVSKSRVSYFVDVYFRPTRGFSHWEVYFNTSNGFILTQATEQEFILLPESHKTCYHLKTPLRKVEWRRKPVHIYKNPPFSFPLSVQLNTSQEESFFLCISFVCRVIINNWSINNYYEANSWVGPTKNDENFINSSKKEKSLFFLLHS